MHTLGALYESMLHEMRDATGVSGEFHTPRAGMTVHLAETKSITPISFVTNRRCAT